MIITLSFNQREEYILTAIASKSSLTPNEYCENIVRNFVIAQIRGYYQKKFNEATIAQLISILGEPVIE